MIIEKHTLHLENIFGECDRYIQTNVDYYSDTNLDQGLLIRLLALDYGVSVGFILQSMYESRQMPSTELLDIDKDDHQVIIGYHETFYPDLEGRIQITYPLFSDLICQWNCIMMHMPKTVYWIKTSHKYSLVAGSELTRHVASYSCIQAHAEQAVFGRVFDGENPYDYLWLPQSCRMKLITFLLGSLQTDEDMRQFKEILALQEPRRTAYLFRPYPAEGYLGIAHVIDGTFTKILLPTQDWLVIFTTWFELVEQRVPYIVCEPRENLFNIYPG